MVAAINNTNMVRPHPPTETDTVVPTTAPTTTAHPMGNNAVSEQAYTARRLLLLNILYFWNKATNIVHVLRTTAEQRVRVVFNLFTSYITRWT
jgi:hypothetical protein